jgi:hypothetical protein
VHLFTLVKLSSAGQLPFSNWPIFLKCSNLIHHIYTHWLIVIIHFPKYKGESVNKVNLQFSLTYVLMNSVLHYCTSEHAALVISLQSWQYCHWQSVVKMARLMLYLNSLYLLTHPRNCANFNSIHYFPNIRGVCRSFYYRNYADEPCVRTHTVMSV